MRSRARALLQDERFILFLEAGSGKRVDIKSSRLSRIVTRRMQRPNRIKSEFVKRSGNYVPARDEACIDTCVRVRVTPRSSRILSDIVSLHERSRASRLPSVAELSQTCKNGGKFTLPAHKLNPRQRITVLPIRATSHKGPSLSSEPMYMHTR